MTRRGFAGVCATAAATALLPACEEDDSANQRRVLVIGGGVAGLAAARRLTDEGFDVRDVRLRGEGQHPRWLAGQVPWCGGRGRLPLARPTASSWPGCA